MFTYNLWPLKFDNQINVNPRDIENLVNPIFFRLEMFTLRDKRTACIPINFRFIIKIARQTKADNGYFIKRPQSTSEIKTTVFGAYQSARGHVNCCIVMRLF